MTLDVSLEAIEADLAIADRGGQVATIALARAQVRATLLARHVVGPRPGDETAEELTSPVWVNDTGQDILIAEGPDAHVFTVPKGATWDDRVTAAAMLLGIEGDSLRYALQLQAEARDGYPEGFDDPEPPAKPLVDPTRITTRNTEDDPRNDDDTEDVFAEARKARKK